MSEKRAIAKTEGRDITLGDMEDGPRTLNMKVRKIVSIQRHAKTIFLWMLATVAVTTLPVCAQDSASTETRNNAARG